MRAVITAGGRIGGAFAQEAGTTVKALAPLADGTSHLDRILAAIRGLGISDIAVVGSSEIERVLRGRARYIEEGLTGRDNVQRALHAWPDTQPLLYATSDMPFATAQSLRDFVDRSPADTVAMPLSELEAYCARFPGALPAGITLGGQTVVNGGVFLMPQGSIASISRVAGTFFDARKAPWKMASLVGPAFLLQFALRRLTIAALEAQAAKTLGVPAAAVRGCAPELGFDCDTELDYRYALAHA